MQMLLSVFLTYIKMKQKAQIQKKKSKQEGDTMYCANKFESSRHCMNPATPALNVMRYISWLHKDETRKRDVRNCKPTVALNIKASSTKIQSSNKSLWKRRPPPAHCPRSLHSVCNLVWSKKSKPRSEDSQSFTSQDSTIYCKAYQTTVVPSSDTQNEELSGREQVNDLSPSIHPEVIPTEEEVENAATVALFNTTDNSKQ